MQITKEQLLQDPYEACNEYNLDPETATNADNLFYAASRRLVSFKARGDYKPPTEAIIPDVWDFYSDDERQIMQQANHPFYQAWVEITGQT